MKAGLFRVGLLLLGVFLLSGPLFAEEEPVPAEPTEKTILMDESLIVGVELGTIGGQQQRIPGPALSTTLRWEGVVADALDIPKEILEHLSQSDLSFFKNRETADDLNDDLGSSYDE